MDRSNLNYNFSISTIEVDGFVPAIMALRLPFGRDCRSIVAAETFQTLTGIQSHSSIVFDPKDIKLLQSLLKGGDEEAKVLRGIIAYVDINAPRYWWQECDTYKIGAERLSSNSTMHQQGQGLSTQELVDMKEKLEEGTMQERIWYFSYQTLRRIYRQRRHHRLPHWHDFCDWIETLPYAKELITFGLDEGK